MHENISSKKRVASCQSSHTVTNVCMSCQSHISRARSRSVGQREARKRRAESAASTNRSHSVSKSRPPRDKSGVRDEVVSLAFVSQTFISVFCVFVCPVQAPGL